MKPIRPEGWPSRAIVEYAKDQQDKYEVLPAAKLGDPYGMILTSWKLTWKERWALFCGKSLQMSIMTFGRPLLPVKLFLGTDPYIEQFRKAMNDDDLELARIERERAEALEAFKNKKVEDL